MASEPLADYQRWTLSHAEVFVAAGEDIRYVPRSALTSVAVPGSGDFYVFDDRLVHADATVAMKAERTAVALSGAKRLAVVLGEQALRTRRTAPDEMPTS